MGVINTLEVRITGDTTDLDRKLRASATAVAKWGAAATVAAAAAGAALVRSGLNSADALAKQAKQLGITSKELATLRRAADMAGVSQGQLEVATRTLTTRLGEAIQGTGRAGDAFARLGLSADDLAKKPLPDQIDAINTALADTVPAAERATVASRLFGERGALAIAQMSPETIRAAADQIDRLGGALSDVEAAQIEAANDAMSQMDVLTTGVSQRLAAQFAPALHGIADLLFDAAKETDGFKTAVESAYHMAINGAAFVLDAVDGIKRTFEMVADGIVAAVAWVVQAIAKDVAWVLDKLSYIPGVDYSEAVSSLQGFAKTSAGVVDEALANISDTLEEPLAGAKFKQFVADAEAAARAAAEAAQKGRESTGGDGELGDVGGGGETDDEKARREAMEKRLEVLREGLMTERELEALRQEERMELLREGLELELLTKAEYDQLKRDYEKEHQDKLTAIEEAAAAARTEIAEEEAAAKEKALGDAMSRLTTLMNSDSREMFAIGKAAALAQATVDGYAAITGAYKVGASQGGPWLGAAYAAAAGAATWQQINAIKSTSFGDGGGASGSSTQAVNDATTPVASGGGGGATQSQELRVSGIDSSALFTGDMVRGLAEELLDFQRQGGKVMLA